MVRRNPVLGEIPRRGPRLAAPGWCVTAGAVFQTAWNVVTGRPTAGIRDDDLFYCAPEDLSYQAEDAVIRRAATLFAATCCVGLRTDGGAVLVYAPHGSADLFNLVVRPNPVLAPRSVYETKAARWRAEWPELTVLPWPAA